MRVLPFVLSAVVTTGLVVALNNKIGALPPVGKLLSPSHGLWKNAEPANADFSAHINAAFLKNKVNVYLDERLVPHVFAQNDHDAYFVQGYLAAKFRLWQMEFQTHAAGGRLSEVLGEKVGTNSVLELSDRKFRRMGLLWAAENALKEMQKNPSTWEAMTAYTAGANSYISQLQPADFPIEYKLLDYAPEAWSNLKSALLMKYMAFDLANDGDDFEYTNLLQKTGIVNFEKMFPRAADSLDPILPKGLPINVSTRVPVAPSTADSLYLKVTNTTGVAYTPDQKDPDLGSNNWIVGGGRTASGRPILCNDPHLALSMPSLWSEVQLHTPEQNVYGVCLQGVPGVMIGFNDSLAWGLTNAMRDVMDFYEIKFKDSTMNEYWYDSLWQKTEWRTETIRIRGKADFADKIPMTIWGPVMYDGTYQSQFKNGKAYAIRWKAHEPSQEISGLIGLNHARNYDDYLTALQLVNTPGQNFVMATKTNNIAWWQQASFPAKWRRQGDFIMPGWDSTYRWQGNIASSDNLHLINPERGFISSANQLPADSSYPYYLGGLHDVYRGVYINRLLRADSGVTVDDMKTMQNDNYNVFAEMARPLLLKYVNEKSLSGDAKTMLDLYKNWNLRGNYEEKGMTVFINWWRCLRDTVWNDDIVRADALPTAKPYDQTLLEGLLKDSAYPFIDDVKTIEVENLAQMVTASLNKAAEYLKSLPALEWGKVKDTHINHLLKIEPFSRLHLPIGGGSKMINATTEGNGPSWRMIVEMTDDINAWGVYPGGQSGNPGSRFYDDFVNAWATGKYYKLWLMKAEEAQTDKVKWTMSFSPKSS